MLSDESNMQRKTSSEGVFKINGHVRFEGAESPPDNANLAAYALDGEGQLLGEGVVGPSCDIEFFVKLSQPAEIELVIAPAGNPQDEKAFRQVYTTEAWASRDDAFHLEINPFIPSQIWLPWYQLLVCIDGHIRKVQTNEAGEREYCPVPYVKVEIFDVDREACYWPYFNFKPDLILDEPVVSLADLIQELPNPPQPVPDPFSIPEIEPFSPFSRAGSEPVVSVAEQQGLGANVNTGLPLTFLPQHKIAHVGEMARLPEGVASRLDRLTLTSKIAPWHIFSQCFYSRELACGTYTDCNGYFRCCFLWPPYHRRYGRLRTDYRPDIIIRVTQIIDGVETVIYLDPYTSTRWNVTNAHIDLFLDDPQILCGQGCDQPPLPGSKVFIEQVGVDPVYHINKHNGYYEIPPTRNVAYGGKLDVFAQFGEDLSDGNYFYRLSYAKQYGTDIPADRDFKRINHPERENLKRYRRHRRASPSTSGEWYDLGPKPLPGVEGPIYEIRNRQDYVWPYDDERFIGTWNTLLAEEDTGTYILRLEVFDADGNKLTAPRIEFEDNRGNGSGRVPTEFPLMGDHYDLVITIDNKPVELELNVPTAINECGVVPWEARSSLTFDVHVSQPNGRLHSWNLTCNKGIAATHVGLGSRSSGSSLFGLPSPVDVSISGAPLLTGLDSTCAFALKLKAEANIRNNLGHYFSYEAPTQAIAIEKCPPCPEGE